MNPFLDILSKTGPLRPVSVVVRKFFNVSFSRIQFPFSQVSLAKVINVLKANLRSLLALAFERERERRTKL